MQFSLKAQGSNNIYTVSYPELRYKARKELHKAARRFLEISSRLLLQSLDGKKQ